MRHDPPDIAQLARMIAHAVEFRPARDATGVRVTCPLEVRAPNREVPFVVEPGPSHGAEP